MRTDTIPLSNVNCLFKQFFFSHIELPLLKRDFAEEGNNVYDVRGTIA